MRLNHVNDSSVSTVISLSVSVEIKNVVLIGVAKVMPVSIGALGGESSWVGVFVFMKILVVPMRGCNSPFNQILVARYGNLKVV